MAPEIALAHVAELAPDSVVLDPMSGSGMVLSQASRKGMKPIGFDLDPLAKLISKVGATNVNPDLIRKRANELLHKVENSCERGESITLDWIDSDPETSKFIDYWFAEKQRHQLRAFALHLIATPFTTSRTILDFMKVAVSRLIVTKEPKASLARDTAHSRPHRTILQNDFDIVEEFHRSIEQMLSALKPHEILTNAKVYKGDARQLSRLEAGSVDAIITSPPYLNAIDYMRGHKMSLVWMGYTIRELREIRATSIGSEKSMHIRDSEEFDELHDALGLNELTSRQTQMLFRYYIDLKALTAESARVLRSGANACYVIGNSNIKDTHVRNSEFLKSCARSVGLKLVDEQVREIPNNRRYMPISLNKENSLSKRMRTEHIISFEAQ
ncbi:MAG: hypothetical protein JJ919_03835 [Henriciella sp.]|nr:hypothetical protein [Henriciella sp.]